MRSRNDPLFPLLGGIRLRQLLLPAPFRRVMQHPPSSTLDTERSTIMNTATMNCSTAGLTRGEQVTVLRVEFDTFAVVDNGSGTEQTVMLGDLCLHEGVPA